MRKPIRMLLIVGNSKYGGATYLILSWCKFLLEKGLDVTLLCTDEITINQAKDLVGVKIVDSIFIPRDINLVHDIKALWQLQKLIKENKYYLVHTHTSTPGVLGRIAAKIAQTPVILHTAHGWPVTEFSSNISKFTYSIPEYIAGLVATKVICVSHSTRVFGQNSFLAPKNKLLTICNGIDVLPFLNSKQIDRLKNRHRLNLSDSDFVIGATGRLTEQKDPHSIIRAVYLLTKFLPDRKVKMVLAGDGLLREELHALVYELGLAESVYFLGFWQEIPALLSSLDVFVSASLWEGLSISVMEAMASRLPIVATSIPSNTELIEDEITGLLVTPRSAEAIAMAIARFAFDSDLAHRCASNAQQRILANYTIDRMHQETWELYSSLLEESVSYKIFGFR